MSYDLTKLENGLNEIKIKLSDNQINKLLKYYDLLIEQNKVMNLTTITEFEEVVEKHFLDSLSIFKVVDLNNPFSIIDIGTGAGFPGIPLKIAFPNLTILLADSVNKKIKFLDHVIMELNLDNIDTIHARAEEMAKKKEFREKFDICVSRAVANLSSLSEYCLPFVKYGGMFISYKSGEIEEELSQAKSAVFLLGGKLKVVEKFKLAGTEISRSLVIINKDKKTPREYPRKAGIPLKNPIR
ncbi:16S rRNA (guanine(527)-N(7))-methyltransferase RsmG [Lachnospiraceae bacterium ZAX-1]